MKEPLYWILNRLILYIFPFRFFLEMIQKSRNFIFCKNLMNNNNDDREKQRRF